VDTIDRVAGDRRDLHGIRIALHGHPHRYVVGITTGKGGPRLVDLRIQSSSDVAITPDVLRAIPSRRLAHAAAKWVSTVDGLFGFLRLDPATREALYEIEDPKEFERAAVEAVAASKPRPEESTARGRLDDSHYREVAEMVRAAVASGYPIRKTVAAQYKTTIPTLDRWIRKAKDLGFLDEDELPRRNTPDNSGGNL
jgi:hypothetical protein